MYRFTHRLDEAPRRPDLLAAMDRMGWTIESRAYDWGGYLFGTRHVGDASFELQSEPDRFALYVETPIDPRPPAEQKATWIHFDVRTPDDTLVAALAAATRDLTSNRAKEKWVDWWSSPKKFDGTKTTISRFTQKTPLPAALLKAKWLPEPHQAPQGPLLLRPPGGRSGMVSFTGMTWWMSLSSEDPDPLLFRGEDLVPAWITFEVLHAIIGMDRPLRPYSR